MSVVVNMACGLANRMFQYSYFLYLVKNGFDVNVDYYKTSRLAHEDVPWERIFPNASFEQASAWQILKLGGGSDILSKLRRRYFPFSTKVINMPTAFSAFLPQKDSSNCYVFGVFQNARMADEVREEVQRKFVFSPFEDNENRKLEKEMQECESVAIHIRKGDDYQSRIWYQNTCPLSYYKDAIALMQEKLQNPRFYVFADNRDWVKKNFSGFEYTLVVNNPVAGWGAHFDMQLMSCCKHNIISNSTYSWWGAFLNRNSQKIVVLPKQWFNPESCEDSTSEKVQCKDWIAL